MSAPTDPDRDPQIAYDAVAHALSQPGWPPLATRRELIPTLTVDGAQLHLSLRQTDRHLDVDGIRATPGHRLGTRALHALRQHARDTDRVLRITHVMNPDFFDAQPWLVREGDVWIDIDHAS